MVGIGGDVANCRNHVADVIAVNTLRRICRIRVIRVAANTRFLIVNHRNRKETTVLLIANIRHGVGHRGGTNRIFTGGIGGRNTRFGRHSRAVGDFAGRVAVTRVIRVRQRHRGIVLMYISVLLHIIGTGDGGGNRILHLNGLGDWLSSTVLAVGNVQRHGIRGVTGNRNGSRHRILNFSRSGCRRGRRQAAAPRVGVVGRGGGGHLAGNFLRTHARTDNIVAGHILDGDDR